MIGPLFAALLLQAPPCPAAADSLVAAGWQAYRAGRVPEAETRFAAAVRRCPESDAALVGLGFARLRADALAAAESLFTMVTTRNPAIADAWDGLATAAWRRGDAARAHDAWSRALAIAPGHEAAREGLARASAALGRDAPPVAVPAAAPRTAPDTPPVVRFRTRGTRFERRTGDRWSPFFLKGVNLGAALPGRAATEFPDDSATYARWLALIAGTGANTLRLYTVLPPPFYRALAAHNATARAPLLLMQGIWVEVPPGLDFRADAFEAEVAAEVRSAVDVIHGRARRAPRPGHAAGRYDADVSAWTVAWLFGREWEPYALERLERDAGAPRTHAGTHLTLESGTPAEAWIVRHCDLLLAYEEQAYGMQRPVAYVNWPTTDPIVHPTETTFAEQQAFLGRPVTSDPDDPAHDEEGVALDPLRVRATPRNAAGWFAAYHVYPYYPDFLLNDPDYARARSSLGPSRYFGYLRALRRAHERLPLVIAEFGIPSSRGNSHLQPDGWHHGGLREAEAAAVVARLAREIHESGAAGAIAFEFMDEWFKRDWLTRALVTPEGGARWHDVQSPEQHYGLVGLRAGSAPPVPGGDAGPWHRLAPVLTRVEGDAPDTLRAGADASYLYLALSSRRWRAGAPFPARLVLGVDTHDPALGQRRLTPGAPTSAAGFEYQVVVTPDAAEVRVLPEYSPFLPVPDPHDRTRFGETFRGPVTSRVRDDARFDSLWVMTNRPRFTRDGTLLPGAGVTMGRLRRAVGDAPGTGPAAHDALADWWLDRPTGTLQVRLPWALLNVGDPSRRLVRADTGVMEVRGDARGWRVTEGFRFAVLTLGADGRPTGALPAAGLGAPNGGTWTLDDLTLWTWDAWDRPTWHEYLKPAYHALRAAWEAW